MFAQDFLFNNQKLSDFGFIIAGDMDGESVASGGEIDIVSVRPPDSDKHDFYTGNLDSPIQYTFGIIKYKCGDKNDIYVTPEEESRLAKWLMRKSKVEGYKWLQFDEDYYRDINYKVCFTEMNPVQVGGKTIGFTLSCTSNCGYAYSNEKMHKFTLSNNGVKEIIVTSDMSTYIYPKITLTGNIGNIVFGNNDDDGGHNFAEIKTTSGNKTIVLDCENDIITGISAPDEFNYQFPKMVDGSNHFRMVGASSVAVEIVYREARRIIV